MAMSSAVANDHAMMIFLAMTLAAPVSAPAGETRAQYEAAASALHRRLDADHDGYVTYAEARVAALALVVPKGQSIDTIPDSKIGRAEFDRVDTNHDGRISIDEEIAGADRGFAESDTNHDGVVSAEERAAYLARFLTALQSEMATWKPLPCHPGAACATARP